MGPITKSLHTRQDWNALLKKIRQRLDLFQEKAAPTFFRIFCRVLKLIHMVLRENLQTLIHGIPVKFRQVHKLWTVIR